MTFEYEERAVASRFVDIIWRTHDTSDGTYLAAADACWDMIFIRSVHGNRVLLSGPSSKITPVPYRAGNRNVGIRFHRGTFLTHVPTTAMVDTTEALPMPSETRRSCSPGSTGRCPRTSPPTTSWRTSNGSTC